MGASMKMASILVITLVLSTLCCLTTATSCPSGWTALLDSCYLMQEVESNFFEAQEFCWAQGGYVAEITTAAENELLRVGLLDMGHEYWIGLEDLTHDGTWRWAESQEAATWTNWHSGEPNNYGGEEYCVKMWCHTDRDGCGWDDVPCYQTGTGKIVYIVCERDT